MKLNQHFTTQISEILFSSFDVVAIFHFSPPTLHCMARGAFESLSPSCTFQGDTALYYILPFENHSRISCQKYVKKLSTENRNLRFEIQIQQKMILVDQFGPVQFTSVKFSFGLCFVVFTPELVDNLTRLLIHHVNKYYSIKRAYYQ